MKLLLFYASEIDALGGAELSVLSLAEGLTKRGHQATILEFARRRSKRRLASGITVLSIPRTICPEPGRPGTWLRFSRSVWQFLRIIQELKPDVVSVQFPSWQSLPVVAAHALPHKWRLVVTARGSDIRVIPFSLPRLKRWQSRLLEQADAISAVSQSLLRDLLNLYPFASGNACVIHNTIDSKWSEEPALETFRLCPERYVLFVGAFRHVKGIDVLLHAWQRLQGRVPGVSLILVGAGADLDSVLTLSERLGVSGSVRFVGAKSRGDLPALYRDAQLVVVPSRNEGLPRVALEAGACGAICVGSKVGGLPEIIDDQVTGFLVEPESPEMLAEAMLHALNLSDEVKQRMSAAAKRRIRERFDYERMIVTYEQLFQSLLRKGPRNQPMATRRPQG
jgi:glycosyltransferase involved in cell wall biosynthesis